jgi:hypothetical protein
MVDPREPLIVPRGWIALTLPIAIGTITSSVAGAFGHAYVNETPSWAAQGAGQDLANLAVVVPLLLSSAYLAWRGSIRALLVWVGVLLYLLYSYVLYAFYVHFNPFFLVYVATLGMTFYAVAGVVLTTDYGRVAQTFDRQSHVKGMSVFLMAVSVLFALLWLSEIVPALVRGVPPRGVEDLGFPVNPVHVLDLAFAVPGLFIAGVLLRRHHVYGFFFAVPCATFLIAMGTAILAMAWETERRGLPGASGVPIPIVIIIAASMYETYRYLDA